MPYNVYKMKAPDDSDELQKELKELLYGTRNPQVIYIPKLDMVFAISESHYSITELAKENARNFLKARVKYAKGERIYCGDLFYEYLAEVPDNRLDQRWLGRLLKEVFPNVEKKQIRYAGKRTNVYDGIAFKPPK